MCDEITYPFLNFNGCTVEVEEWIGYFTPHFIMDGITYPCWDLSWTMLVKGVPGILPPLLHVWHPPCYASPESILVIEGILFFEYDCASFGSIKKHFLQWAQITIIVDTGCDLSAEVLTYKNYYKTVPFCLIHWLFGRSEHRAMRPE